MMGMLGIYSQQNSSVQCGLLTSYHAASFVKVVRTGAGWSDVMDKKVKASGFPGLCGPFRARLSKTDDLADGFFLSCTDPTWPP